jgi:probable lipoprotein NlpC
MKKIFLTLLLFIWMRGYSQFALNKDTNTMFKFIGEWIGKPYKLGGDSKFGIDCSNFVSKLYNDVFGMTVKGTCHKLWKQTNRITFDSIQFGDLIFFDSPQSPSGWHVGVYLGDGQFIHSANRKEGVKFSCIDEPYYKKHYKGAGRF